MKSPFDTYHIKFMEMIFELSIYKDDFMTMQKRMPFFSGDLGHWLCQTCFWFNL